MTVTGTDRVAAILAELTLEEKAQLTAGRDMWTTVAVDRLGIPPVRMTDGPNGARGSSMFGAAETTATCVPCGTALAATWDPGLVERVGELLGAEARAKGARILLAPTVNIHRSPSPGATSSASPRTRCSPAASPPHTSAACRRRASWRR